MAADRGRPMNFGFADEQEVPRAQVGQFVEPHVSLEDVSKVDGRTPDIQPDLIAERILGLPKDRDAGRHGST